MLRRRALLSALGVPATAAFVVWAGCETVAPVTSEPDPVLVSIAEGIALPAFARFADASRALATSLGGFAEARDLPGLLAARAAWASARTAQRHTRPYGFGVSPKEAAQVDYFPVKPETIETLLTSDAALAPATVASLGTSAKGLLALEYLLFDSRSDDDAVLARFGGESEGARRRTLVALLGADLALHAGAMLTVWAPEGGAFASELALAGAGSEAYASAQGGLDDLVNEAVFSLEYLADHGLARPLGLKNEGVPQPEEEVLRRSDLTLADLLAELEAFERMVRGVGPGHEGPGLATRIAERRAGLEETLFAAVHAAREALLAIPSPLRVAVTESPAAVEAAYVGLRELKRLVATEVVTALGVTLTFNDNDGD